MGVLKTVGKTVGAAADLAVYAWVADCVDRGFALRVGARPFEEASGLGPVGSRGGGLLRGCAAGGPAAFVRAFVGGFGAVVEAVGSVGSSGLGSCRGAGEVRGMEDVPAARLTFEGQEIESMACLQIAVAPDRLYGV